MHVSMGVLSRGMTGPCAPARLRKREDFLRVQAHGRRFRRQYVTVLMARSGFDSEPRVGFTVSRKVGNAVVRNRVRRRLRELTRTQGELFVAGWDYVVVASPAAATAPFAALGEEVVTMLEQAHAWAQRSGAR